MLGASAHPAAPEPDFEEVTVADRVGMAFYERAPTSIVRDMTATVRRACKSDESRAKIPERLSWLCTGQSLTFFRGVLSSGFKWPSGPICNDLKDKFIGTADLPSLLKEATCVFVSQGEKAYELDFD